MTAAINNNVVRLPRVNTEPLAPSASKPGLSRTNSAPAALPSQTTKPSTPAATTAPAAQPKGFGTKVADVFSNAGKAMKNSVEYRTNAAQSSGIGATGRPMAAAGLAGGLGSIGTNAKGLHDAIANNQGGQAIAASALGLTRGVLSTVKGGLDTAAAFTSAKGFGKLQGEASKLVGNAHGALSKPIAEAAATAVHKGQALRDVDVLSSIARSKGALSNIKHTAIGTVAEQLRSFNPASKLAGKLENYSAGKGQQLAQKLGGDAAKGGKLVDGALDAAKTAEAGLSAGAKGVGTAAKIAGRFAPGLNIAMAGVDTAIAARTLSDPKSSVASKVTSSITAAGSIAAATNIPIVSQVGAGVSALSSITGMAINHFTKK